MVSSKAEGMVIPSKTDAYGFHRLTSFEDSRGESNHRKTALNYVDDGGDVHFSVMPATRQLLPDQSHPVPVRQRDQGWRASLEEIMIGSRTMKEITYARWEKGVDILNTV